MNQEDEEVAHPGNVSAPQNRRVQGQFGIRHRQAEEYGIQSNLGSAVCVGDPNQTTVLDLLRMRDYPNDYVPIVAEPVPPSSGRPPRLSDIPGHKQGDVGRSGRQEPYRRHSPKSWAPTPLLGSAPGCSSFTHGVMRCYQQP
jgi:hypothetical protein